MNVNQQRKVAFDIIKSHLLTQMEQSMAVYPTKGNPEPVERCSYRSEDGCLKCAIGSIIENRYYHRRLEGMTPNDSGDSEDLLEAIKSSGHPIDVWSLTMYTDLQRIHDNYSPVKWKNMLEELEGVLTGRDYF